MRKCRVCSVLKALEEFSFANQAVGRRHSVCRDCFAVYRQAHYREHKALYVERNNRNIRKRANVLNRWLFEYLLDHPCVDCGETDPIVLEFDHLDPQLKRMKVTLLAHRGYSAGVIEAEVANALFAARTVIVVVPRHSSPGPARGCATRTASKSRRSTSYLVVDHGPGRTLQALQIQPHIVEASAPTCGSEMHDAGDPVPTDDLDERRPIGNS